MSVAFRIRTQAGQELSFASHEAFEDFVRAGDLSPDDLVYDAETGSWSSALTHPLVLDIQYEQEERDAAAADAEATDGPDAAESSGGTSDDESDPTPAEGSGDSDSGDDDEGDLGLSLAPVRSVEPKTPGEAADPSVPEIERAVVMPSDDLDEPEGAPDLDYGGAALGVTMENRGSLGEMLSTPTTSVEDEQQEPSEKPRIRTARPPSGRKGGGGRRWAAAVVLLAVVGGGGYVGLQLMDQETEPAPEETVGSAPDVVEAEPEPEPPPQPTIATSEAAVRERARERYLTASQAVLRSLESIPAEWATAEYFATPSDYPEMPGLWSAYVTTMETFRTGDRDRYTVALDAALDDAAIRGEQRAERTGRAMALFDAGAAARAAHFDRVEALASAAVQSHAALLEIEGLILIDPSGPIGIQSGIGRGAYGRDPDSQLLLDQVVEVLNETLRAGGAGPGQGENVREWAWGGFLDAVTSGS